VKNKNGSVIDRKHVPVHVVIEEPDSYVEFFTRASFPELFLGKTDDLDVDGVEKTLPSNLKCKNERQAKVNGFDLSTPVVCDPESSSGFQQELGLSVSLLCIAEAHPPPKVEWYREIRTPDGTEKLEKIHMSAKSEIAINEFSDFYQLVSLTINQLEKSDYGVYICTATNSKGDKDTMRINLEEPQKNTFKISSSATSPSIDNAFAYWFTTSLMLFILR
jgi:hypothetical protein